MIYWPYLWQSLKLWQARGSSESFQPNFVHLHDIARHIVHSNETLDVAVDTIGSVQYHQRVFSAINSQTQENQSQLHVQNKFYSLQKELKCIKRRSESLGERLQHEIKLVSVMGHVAFPYSYYKHTNSRNRHSTS